MKSINSKDVYKNKEQDTSEVQTYGPHFWEVCISTVFAIIKTLPEQQLGSDDSIKLYG